MKTSLALFLAAAGAIGVPLWLIAPSKPSGSRREDFTGVNFAHRGLHSADKSIPENSLAAFALAASKGYGIELDVRLTKDGRVVVFHDDTLERVCGDTSRVDEKTLEELGSYRLCGTEQRIPLFSEALAVIDGRGPLIVELKSGKSNDELCEKTCGLLREYKGKFCIESFDPRIVAWFKKNAPDILRGQLATKPGEYTGQSPALAFALGNCLMNFLGRPGFIAYRIGPRPLTVRLADAMGALNIGWTSHDKASENGRDGVIFEFYTPSVKFK